MLRRGATVIVAIDSCNFALQSKLAMKKTNSPASCGILTMVAEAEFDLFALPETTALPCVIGPSFNDPPNAVTG